MTNKQDHSFITVGIGASAGGLTVLKKFVRSLPEKTNMSFIIIQHLDPSHKSMLGDLLSRESKLRVKEAENNEAIKTDCIYVIPPNSYLEVDDGNIVLTKPPESPGFRKAIDHFFRSLAQECGENSAGIILSGSGSDGTAGLRSIKAANGLALAQNPETAEHPSMPESAIHAEVVDKVCEVEEMFKVLSRFEKKPIPKIEPGDEDKEEGDEQAKDSLSEVSAILKTQEKFNLSQYKPSTVQRRIGRRMSLTNTERFDDYLTKLRNDQQERQLLTKDLMINVTDFFRDSEAFSFLEENIIPDILNRVKKDEDIRVWVAGCASGEEAYSIAILLLEAISRENMENDIRIFATDINEHAIKIARRGLYPASIASEVPKKYLDKYFVKAENDHHYRINNEVRDFISFAVQNVANDPPFNRMHLISCRNLLIYFNRKIQQKVLSSLYFSLHEDYYLFLGSSESLGKKAELFKAESKKWRIYRKIAGQNNNRRILANLYADPPIAQEKESTSKRESKSQSREKTYNRADTIRKSIFNSVVPPTVVVDEDEQVLFSHGDLQPYLSWPEGEPTNKITQLVNPDLKSSIRSALFKARQSQEPLSFHFTLDAEVQQGARRVVKVDVIPISDQNFASSNAFSIVFTEGSKLEAPERQTLNKDDENKAYDELERELAETREELQNTIEQLETSTEELKASHEEALSTNEELQSSNEELEASSEELRSLNEELSTVNTQLKDKIYELQRANNDLENFFDSTDIPTLFLDVDLKVLRYTPAAEQLLRMGPRDLHREIHDLSRELLNDGLKKECEEVLRNFQPKQKDIEDQQGRHFIRKLLPYRTADRKIEGVVLSFQDVTELKKLTKRAESREQQQAVVSRLGMLALGGTDPKELMRQAVRLVAYVMDADFCKILKYQPEQHNFLLTSGIGWQEGLVGKATVPDDQNSQAGYNLMAGEPVIVQDLSKDKRFSGPELLVEHQVTSGISCLINHTDPPYGVLGVHTRKERIFTKDDTNFLQSVASMLSTALSTRQAQDLVFESEEKFRLLANSIPQLAWMADKTGYIFWYNQRWYDFTGTSPEEVKGWGWQKVHHPDHVDRVVNAVKRCFASGEDWEDTFPLRNKEGAYRWFLSRAKPIHNQNGELVRWFGTNTDITEQLQQEEALRINEDKLRLAKDSARLGMFEYNIPERKIFWEPLLYQIWGIGNKDDVTLDTFFSSIHPDDIAKTRSTIEASTDPAGDGHYEVVYRVINQKDHQTYWIKASATVIFEQGKAIRMIGLINDITEQKKLEVSLHQAIEDAEKAARVKNEFLSTMSHEIRTPMNAIIGLSNLLLRKDPRPDQKEKLDTLRFSSQSLLNLVNDILDFNKLEDGKVELEKIHYDLPRLISSIRNSYLSVAAQKQNQLTFNIADEVPDTLLGDPYKLIQVLNNLLSNANKFTLKGEISLNISLEKQQGKEVTLYFGLQDTGVGIPEDKLDIIFEKFSQADNSIMRQYGGTGLGLSISKILLQLMGSDLQVSSKVGEGSTFYFSLPQLIGDKQLIKDDTRQAAQRTDINIGEIHLLLVEDAEINRMVLQEHLREWWDISADEAVDGLDAVEKAAQYQYDLILMDVRMPRMDGIEASRRIRQQNKHNEQVPIIALTADTSLLNTEKEKDRLFDSLITKPFDPDQLFQAMISLLPRHKVAPEEASVDKEIITEPEVRFAKVQAQFENRETILTFMEKAQNSLNEFWVNYAEGMRQGDRERVGNALHKVKVVINFLELDELHREMSEASSMLEANDGQDQMEQKLSDFQQSLERVEQAIKTFVQDVMKE